MYPTADFNPNDERYVFNPDVSIQDIKRYYKEYNNRGSYFSMFETGLNGYRFDLIRIDPRKKYVRIFEFKSCRKDFLSDKKWRNYLQFCNTLTFVCPREAIKKEDLPSGIGLIWVFGWKYNLKDQHPSNYSYYNQWHLAGERIKNPRKRNMDIGTYLDLTSMMLMRVIFRKDDLF